MPFKSKAQQRWMFATHPKMAKRWAKETESIKKLPEHVKEASLEIESCFIKIAKKLFNPRAIPPVKQAEIDRQATAQAIARKRQGMSPAASRVMKAKVG